MEDYILNQSTISLQEHRTCYKVCVCGGGVSFGSNYIVAFGIVTITYFCFWVFLFVFILLLTIVRMMLFLNNSLIEKRLPTENVVTRDYH